MISRPVRTRLAGRNHGGRQTAQMGGPGLQELFLLRFPGGCVLRRYVPGGWSAYVAAGSLPGRFGLMKARRFSPNWFDFFRGRFLTREAESCARGYAIVVVAEAALGFFEDRVEFLGEEVFCVRG